MGASPARRAYEALEGLRTIGTDATMRLLTALTTVQTFLRGCLSVFAVVIAIQLLHRGDADVGLLNAAVGLGAVAGALVLATRSVAGSLARCFGLGVALWGAPLAAIAVVPRHAAALVFLAVVGLGNVLVDVGVFTLMARLADDRVMARVFAAFEAVLTLGVAGGAALTPAVVDLLGVPGALAALGLLAPLAALAAWPRLRTLDRRIAARDEDIGVLQDVPMLQPLPQAAVESLAAALEPEVIEPGRAVFEQGEPGDRFYVIVAGHAVVVQDGRPIARLAGGDAFGEIALLRACTRTATVRASDDGPLRVSALARDRFLAAVTGYRPSAEAAESVVVDKLSGDRAR
jgi:hypothetical protein